MALKKGEGDRKEVEVAMGMARWAVVHVFLFPAWLLQAITAAPLLHCGIVW